MKRKSDCGIEREQGRAKDVRKEGGLDGQSSKIEEGGKEFDVEEEGW